MGYHNFRPSFARIHDSIFTADAAGDVPTYYIGITAALTGTHTLNKGFGNVLCLKLSDLNLINTTTPAVLIRLGASGDTVAALPATGLPLGAGTKVLLPMRPLLIRIPPQATTLHFREFQGGVGSLFVEYHHADVI